MKVTQECWLQPGYGFVLREGKYFLVDQKEGTATEANQPAFALMADLHMMWWLDEMTIKVEEWKPCA